MEFFEKVSKVAATISAIALLFVMSVTFIDVLGRYALNMPLAYSVEVIKLAMGLVILLGLGLTTFSREHISVDFLVPLMPRKLRLLANRFSAILGALFLGLIAWNFWGKVEAQKSDGLVTQILDLPVYPITFIMAIGATFSALLCLYFVFAPSRYLIRKGE